MADGKGIYAISDEAQLFPDLPASPLLGPSPVFPLTSNRRGHG